MPGSFSFSWLYGVLGSQSQPCLLGIRSEVAETVTVLKDSVKDIDLAVSRV